MAFTVDIETLPYAYVHVQGTAEVDPDPEKDSRVAREITGRYLPALFDIG